MELLIILVVFLLGVITISNLLLFIYSIYAQFVDGVIYSGVILCACGFFIAYVAITLPLIK